MVTHDPIRGSGRSTKQIKGAPQEAIYVVDRADEVPYTRALAASLKRNDITVVDKRWLSRSTYVRRKVVIDHAVELTPEYAYALEFVRKRGQLHVEG